MAASTPTRAPAGPASDASPGASPGPRGSSSIISVPDNIQELRDLLFNLAAGASITIAAHEWRATWPFLDNMYVQRQRFQLRANGPSTKYLWCRLWHKKPYSTTVAEENRKRVRTCREPVGCPCRLKLVDHGDILIISRTSKDSHNHEYDALDFKIPSGVRQLAAQEVAKGYRPSQVVKALKNADNGNLEALQLAGGRRIRSKNAHNAVQSLLLRNQSDRPLRNHAHPISAGSPANWRVQFQAAPHTYPHLAKQCQNSLPPPAPPTPPSRSPHPSLRAPSLRPPVQPPHFSLSPTGPTRQLPPPTVASTSASERVLQPNSNMRSRINIQLPAPLSQIPRYPLLYPDPSPIHPLLAFSGPRPPTPPSHAHATPRHRISVFAKRDDQCAPLACAGNKYRKLEYIIPDVFSQNPTFHYHENHPTAQPLPGPATIIVTEGALQSNHTVQVAAVARRMGLKAFVLLNRDTGHGYKTSSSPEVFAQTGNVQINKLLGAEIRMYNADDPEAIDAQPVLDELRQAGHRPYWIPGGASLHPLGGLGYARAAFEIVSQESESQLGGSGRFDYIFVACGSGSTVGGLIAGFKLLEKLHLCSSSDGGGNPPNGNYLPRNIIGILTSPTRPREYHEERVLRFARRAGGFIGLLDAEREITMDDVHLDDRFVGEGYGALDDETRRVLSLMAEREGVLLDPVYTAKVAAGMIRWAGESEEMTRYAEKYQLQELNVLFIHTGGQAALSAYFDRLV